MRRALLTGTLITLGTAAAPAAQENAVEPDAVEGLLPRSSVPDEHDGVTLDYGPDAYSALAERHARGEPFSLLLPFPGGESVLATLCPVGCLERGARARIVSADGTAW